MDILLLKCVFSVKFDKGCNLAVEIKIDQVHGNTSSKIIGHRIVLLHYHNFLATKLDGQVFNHSMSKIEQLAFHLLLTQIYVLPFCNCDCIMQILNLYGNIRTC